MSGPDHQLPHRPATESSVRDDSKQHGDTSRDVPVSCSHRTQTQLLIVLLPAEVFLVPLWDDSAGDRRLSTRVVDSFVEWC